MAAAGATNRDIAQELFVSEKTVETHLSHAYSKLDIAGAGARDRLAAALSEPS
jgi:DNA-binding NarL/FixJ family response regulator